MQRVPDETSWTLIRAASGGDASARSEFVRRYLPVVRAYLGARWREGSGVAEIDDGVQEVFVECLRDRGVLERAGDGDVKAFRAFLLGVARNVSLRLERERARRGAREKREEPAIEERPALEETLSRIFDRAWAQSLVREAGEAQAKQAHEAGDASLRRVELLRLRFHEGLPIRRIAELWGADPARVHHEYAQARTEFVRALREVIARRYPASPEAVKRVAEEVLSLLD